MLTAYGVYQGMRASAQHLWGDPSLRARRIGIAGVGKVGRHLVEHLVAERAEVFVTDVREEAVRQITERHPDVVAVKDTAELIRVDGLDIYAPCALGGALNDDSVPVLTARIVCGAANNQLAHPGVEKDLADRTILYAPDYVVNAGGVIQVADELHGFDFERCKAKAAKIYDTTLAIFARAKETGFRLPRRRTGSPSSGWRRRGAAEAWGTRRRGVGENSHFVGGSCADKRLKSRLTSGDRAPRGSWAAPRPAGDVPYGRGLRYRGSPTDRSLHGEPVPDHERVSRLWGRRAPSPRGSSHGARPGQGQADEGRPPAEVQQRRD